MLFLILFSENVYENFLITIFRTIFVSLSNWKQPLWFNPSTPHRPCQVKPD